MRARPANNDNGLMTSSDGSSWPAPSGPYDTLPPPPPVDRPITAGSVVGRSAVVGVVSFVAALAIGLGAAVLTGLVLASDGDPGYLEALGTLLWAAIVFLLAGGITYLTAVILGVRWFLPVGRRLVPGLVLTLGPPLLLTLIGVLGSGNV